MGGSRPRRRRQRPPTRAIEVCHARRSADRRRRLPRAERGDPRHRAQGRHRARLRVRRVPRRLAGPARGRDLAARHPAGARDPAARRHHPGLVADQPVHDRGRRRADPGQPRATCGVDALVAIGGEDTLGVATKLDRARRQRSSACRRPSTTTCRATDFTFGFDTAVNIAMEAIDRLHTTAESHHRVLVVEVMGRHAGWIALHAGLAGGANIILIPEEPFDIDAGLRAGRVAASSRHFAPIIVVAEGAVPADGTDHRGRRRCDAFGHVRLGGIGDRLAAARSRRGPARRRAPTVLGHVQRGGTPTAFDRWLATRFGLHAIDAVADRDYGTMVALRGTDIVRVPLAEGDRRAQDRPRRAATPRPRSLRLSRPARARRRPRIRRCGAGRRTLARRG